MKTKIGFMSDVHLEFGHLDVKNNHNVDLLILAGDISTPHYWRMNHDSTVRKSKERQLKFFDTVSKEFPQVFYILGNHEHYRGNVNLTEEILKENLAQFKNILVGDKITLVVNDLVVFGTTLWTDFNNNNSLDLQIANMGMNDFQIVYNDSGNRFRSQDAYLKHLDSKDFLEKSMSLNAASRKIVVTHHLPSYSVISEGFRDSRLNSAYASNLDDMIMKYSPELWIHGHSHPPIDVMIGNTRVVRNPRGYVGHEHSYEEDKKYSYQLIEL